MKSAILRFITITFFSAVFLSGCRSAGSEFLGKWVNKSNPSVSPSGRVGAIYKDGALEVKGAFLTAELTYVKQTDTLLGPGFFSNVEYKRLK